METKWFIGENSSGVFAIYKANFDGILIKDEWSWYLPTGRAWEPTQCVSEWYFIGNDNVWPTSEEVATKYLPEIAK